MAIAPRALCVVLLHSTDEPDRAVAGIDAIRAAAMGAGSGVPLGRPALFLDVEGVRLGAKGVAETLSSGGRPDVTAMLASFLRGQGEVLVVREAWAERGYLDDALVPGARLVPRRTLAEMAAVSHVFVTY